LTSCAAFTVIIFHSTFVASAPCPVFLCPAVQAYKDDASAPQSLTASRANADAARTAAPAAEAARAAAAAHAASLRAELGTELQANLSEGDKRALAKHAADARTLKARGNFVSHETWRFVTRTPREKRAVPRPHALLSPKTLVDLDSYVCV
jgi:hypothetical protein